MSRRNGNLYSHINDRQSRVLGTPNLAKQTNWERAVRIRDQKLSLHRWVYLAIEYLGL